MAALIRKEVQAEKEREKLDMSQLAFPLPRQGKVQLKRQQIGESHGLEPGLPHAPRPSAAQTRQRGHILSPGTTLRVSLWRMALSSTVLAGLFPYYWAGRLEGAAQEKSMAWDD